MNYKRIFVPNSLVFITVVTYHRNPILITHIQTLKKAFCIAKEKSPFELIAFIINPDHFHIIIKPADIKEYPKIIGLIKRTFTQLVPLNHSLNIHRESNIWQRRFWEHTIVNEKDLQQHLDYIHYNSVKHSKIAPKDWPYSSFHKFVERGRYESQWCNDGDKNCIGKWNLE